MIDYFDVDGGVIRVGASSYSATIHSSFNLSAHTMAADVKLAILQLSYAGGYANTAAALAYIRTTMLTSAAGDRRNVSNIIVIFTDGPSSNPLGARVSPPELYFLLSWVEILSKTEMLKDNVLHK